MDKISLPPMTKFMIVLMGWACKRTLMLAWPHNLSLLKLLKDFKRGDSC